MDHEELLRRDSQRMEKQETLHDGMLAKIVEAEAKLHGIGGEKHEVLFVGDTVLNCRKLAGLLNMQPGISCRYEEFGAKVLPDTATIVLATHDPVILGRVKKNLNGADIVIMSQDGVPQLIQDMFPNCFVARNFPAAFGHITKAAAVGS